MLLLHQVAHAGEPEARAAVVLGEATARELVEDEVDVIGMDAAAVVSHAELDPARAGMTEPDLHLTSRR